MRMLPSRSTAACRPSSTATAVGRSRSTISLRGCWRCNPWPSRRLTTPSRYLNGRDPRHPPPEFPATSQIEGELRELRVRFAKTRYRVLYQRSRNLMVLLHLFEKNTRAVTARDRNTAQARMADFEARMNASPRRRPRAAGRDAPPGSRGA